MFDVMDKKSHRVYRVYDVQINNRPNRSEADFLIYSGGKWSYMPADRFTPNFDEDGSGHLFEV